MDEPARGPQPTAGEAPPHPLRGLLAAALESLRTRLDLAAVEIEMHLLALVRMLVWAFGAVACVLLALTFALTALVVSLWDTHRMVALLAGSVVFVGLAVLFGWLGARAIRSGPGLLAGSLQQLQEDQRRTGGDR